jgi:hypothetical protein
MRNSDCRPQILQRGVAGDSRKNFQQQYVVVWEIKSFSFL